MRWPGVLPIDLGYNDEIISFFLNGPRRRRVAYELFFGAMLGEHKRSPDAEM